MRSGRPIESRTFSGLVTSILSLGLAGSVEMHRRVVSRPAPCFRVGSDPANVEAFALNFQWLNRMICAPSGASDIIACDHRVLLCCYPTANLRLVLLDVR